MSKVFNVPLLNITTSFVAEEQALIGKEEESDQTEENGIGCIFSWSDVSTDILSHVVIENFSGKSERKKLLSSVSTSLALAAGLGIAETVALSLGSGPLMTILGIAAVCQSWSLIQYRLVFLFCFFIF